MKISDGEKIIILMLSELYDKLGINGDIDQDFIRSAIYSDNLWGIRWKYSGIPFDSNKDPEVVREVVDILDMWSIIEYSYDRLTPTDKFMVEEQAAPFGKNPKFNGFDGNNESEYMSTAHFIIDDLERFESFKGRYLNSHFPAIDGYKRMLNVFEPMRKKLINEPLSADDLINILKEMIHPENRR